MSRPPPSNAEARPEAASRPTDRRVWFLQLCQLLLTQLQEAAQALALAIQARDLERPLVIHEKSTTNNPRP